MQKISEDELKSQLFKTQLSQSGMRLADPTYETWKNNPPQELEEFNEISKSECAANLSFSCGKSFAITYTALTTVEDEVYVEVFGL